jgi:hypothetical protein
MPGFRFSTCLRAVRLTDNPPVKYQPAEYQPVNFRVYLPSRARRITFLPPTLGE